MLLSPQTVWQSNGTHEQGPVAWELDNALSMIDVVLETQVLPEAINWEIAHELMVSSNIVKLYFLSSTLTLDKTTNWTLEFSNT